jgi:hypothetical protein
VNPCFCKSNEAGSSVVVEELDKNSERFYFIRWHKVLIH